MFQSFNFSGLVTYSIIDWLKIRHWLGLRYTKEIYDLLLNGEESLFHCRHSRLWLHCLSLSLMIRRVSWQSLFDWLQFEAVKSLNVLLREPFKLLLASNTYRWMILAPNHLFAQATYVPESFELGLELSELILLLKYFYKLSISK